VRDLHFGIILEVDESGFYWRSELR